MYWLTLAFALVWLMIGLSGDAVLGPCSADTGYYPDTTIPLVVTLVLLVVGIVEMLVGFTTNRAAFGWVGVSVLVMSLIAAIAIEAASAAHACD